MKKTFECENGTIYVEVPETCNRENLKKVTEDFLKKVLNGRYKNEHVNKTTNFREKQILHR